MGKIIPIPDVHYKCWVNSNKDVLHSIMKSGRIPRQLLEDAESRAYLERYLHELGYELTGGSK